MGRQSASRAVIQRTETTVKTIVLSEQVMQVCFISKTNSLQQT